MLRLFNYKTQRSGLAFALTWAGMVAILLSGAILFVSMPTWFYREPYVNFNPVLSIVLAVLLFMLGYWLTCIFPAIKITDAGIRCKRIYFYKSVKWSEMDNVVEFKNGVMALTIKRKGLWLLNGFFFEWLTGRALRQKDPAIVFTPEFFAENKNIPQEIIANTPATSGVNAYLSGKINGTGFINPSRFSVQETENGVSITIPGKKNFLEVIFLVPMALLWSYFAGYMIYIFAWMNFGAILVLVQGSWESRNYTAFAFMDIFAILFISFVLLWIWLVFSQTARHMAGKETIEATGHSLTITRQLFRWKRRSEYSVASISNLRVNVTKPGAFKALYKGIQTLFGRDGKIIFDFEKKSVRVGLDISEDEANYILDKIKSHLKM